jgi:hypothetical protein
METEETTDEELVAEAIVGETTVEAVETEALTLEPEETADEEPLQEIATTEETVSAKPNVGIVFGVVCVFKPYYEGCEHDDVLKIPVTQQRFASFKERKQIKIFKNAERKKDKEQAKQKKLAQRSLKK